MSTEAERTSEFLFGQTRGRLLATIYGNSDGSFYLRELARLTQSSPGTVKRELDQLCRAGLVEKEDVAKTFYKAAAGQPFFADLRGLLVKTEGAIGRVRSALAAAAQEMDFAAVYGSFARGTERAGSDVDVVIVGNITLDAVLAALQPVEAELGRMIHPTLLGRAEFERKVREGNHFLRGLQSGPLVMLAGNEREFREIC